MISKQSPRHSTVSRPCMCYKTTSTESPEGESFDFSAESFAIMTMNYICIPVWGNSILKLGKL